MATPKRVGRTLSSVRSHWVQSSGQLTAVIEGSRTSGIDVSRLALAGVSERAMQLAGGLGFCPSKKGEGGRLTLVAPSVHHKADCTAS